MENLTLLEAVKITVFFFCIFVNNEWERNAIKELQSCYKILLFLEQYMTIYKPTAKHAWLFMHVSKHISNKIEIIKRMFNQIFIPKFCVYI